MWAQIGTQSDKGTLEGSLAGTTTTARNGCSQQIGAAGLEAGFWVEICEWYLTLAGSAGGGGGRGERWEDH